MSLCPTGSLNHESTLLYLELRKEGLIGKLWALGGAYKLAPVDSLPGLEWHLAESISPQKLHDLIYRLNSERLRKPPESTTRVKEPFLFGNKLA